MKTVVISLLLAVIILTSCNVFPGTNESSNSNKNSGMAGYDPAVPLEIIESPTTDIPFTGVNVMNSSDTLFASYDKFIFPCNGGYYYSIEVGGRDGPNRLFVFDNGDGSVEATSAGEDYVAMWVRENAIYGYKRNDFIGKTDMILLEYANDTLTSLDIEFSRVFFARDNIYFCNSTAPIIYKANYDGGNIQKVMQLDESAVEIESIMVYKNKILYEYINNIEPNANTHFAVYDTITQEIFMFDRGGMDLINGDYSYYMNNRTRSGTEYDGLLYRFDCNTFSIEQISSARIEAYGFFDDYLLYATEGILYRLNDNENKKILSISQLGDANYFMGIQVQNGQIFIQGGAGAYYVYLAEINIDGTIVRKIHED